MKDSGRDWGSLAMVYAGRSALREASQARKPGLVDLPFRVFDRGLHADKCPQRAAGILLCAGFSSSEKALALAQSGGQRLKLSCLKGRSC